MLPVREKQNHPVFSRLEGKFTARTDEAPEFVSRVYVKNSVLDKFNLDENTIASSESQVHLRQKSVKLAVV